MSREPSKLDELIREAAARCRVAGLSIDDQSPSGPIANWVWQNCAVSPSNAFFVVTGIVGAMADFDAQAEGYIDNIDRACAMAWDGVHGSCRVGKSI